MNSATSLSSPWIACRNFFVQYRVPVSALTIGALIGEDVFMKDRPDHACFVDGDTIGRIATGLIVVGLFIRSWAAGIIQKGIDLTTYGPYSLVRHPLYFGSALMMFGFCMLVGEVHDYVVILGPIVGIYCLTILREEERLAAKYGVRWTNYVAQTPRWLPLHPGRYIPCRWSFRQWVQRREYQAMLGAAAGLAAIELARWYWE